MIENFVKIYDNVIDEKSCKGLIEKFESLQDKHEIVDIEDKLPLLIKIFFIIFR